MPVSDIVENVRREIKKYDKPENKLNYQRFFKEKLENPFSLKSSIVAKITNDCFKQLKGCPKNEIFKYCEELLASDDSVEKGIAFSWADKVKGQFAESDFKRFEGWLKKHVHSWAACDSLCCGALGQLILQYSKLAGRTESWAKSKNRWFRRASAVSLILSGRNGKLLDKIFARADILLTDEDDMVQKGYGWMLKEAGNRFPEEVFKYVMKHRREMPRTALRYAIEKFPAAMRKQAMAKD